MLLQFSRSQALKTKQTGSVLVVTLVLGLVLLGIGLQAAAVIIKDLAVQEDLYFSEQAYFAAESGVESALWDLKIEPLQAYENVSTMLRPNVDYDVSIENLVRAFELRILPYKSEKFRLRYDAEPDENFSEQPVVDFDLEIGSSQAGNLIHWRVICQEEYGGGLVTTAVQGALAAGLYTDFLTSQSGRYDRADGTMIPSQGIKGYLDRGILRRDSCFFAVDNIASNEVLVRFESDQMSPAITEVTARTKVKNREKIIRFQYRQKNLAEIFDFVFLQN